MEDINNNNENNIQLSIEKDLNFIKNEIIAKQVDGNFLKYCEPIKAVTITGLSKQQYINYWKVKYKNTEDVDRIVNCCKDKLENGLTDTQTMINLIKYSKDLPKEKTKAIKLLGGES